MRREVVTVTCEYCRRPFETQRHHGRLARFCQRACFIAAKRTLGVIRRIGA